LPGNAVDIGNQFFVAGMCHGLSLDKFWRYVSENAGADKDAYGSIWTKPQRTTLWTKTTM
jgi:hypothetical protein